MDDPFNISKLTDKERKGARIGLGVGTGAVFAAGTAKTNRRLKSPWGQDLMRTAALNRGLDPNNAKGMRAARYVASGLSGARGVFTRQGATGATMGTAAGITAAALHEKRTKKAVQKNDDPFGIINKTRYEFNNKAPRKKKNQYLAGAGASMGAGYAGGLMYGIKAGEIGADRGFERRLGAHGGPGPSPVKDALKDLGHGYKVAHRTKTGRAGLALGVGGIALGDAVGRKAKREKTIIPVKKNDDPFNIEKAIQWSNKTKRKQKPTVGRVATGVLFPGAHGLVAGKKGHKLRAAGNEFGGALIGSLVPGPGSTIGAGLGTDRAAYMGHYKKQVKKSDSLSAFGVEHN